VPFESSETTEYVRKQEHWNQTAAEVKQLRDRLGKNIESGIEETVVALRALGFSTSASCE